MIRLFLVLIAFSASSAFATDPPLTSDIADLGKININGRQVPFFEISGTSDIPISPDVPPNNLPTSIAQDHTRNYGLDSESNLTAPIANFAQLAINGVDAAIGFLSQAAIDLKNAYNNGILQAETSINDIINQTFPASSAVPAVNDVFNSSGINNQCSFTGNRVVTGAARITGQSWPKTSHGKDWVYCAPTQISFFHGETENAGYWFGYKDVINISTTTNPVNFSPSGAPPSIDDSQEAQLAAALKNALAANAALKDALDRTVKNNSSLLGSQPSITSADVQAFAAKAVANANQGLIDSLTQKLAANPNDGALQAALEKAIADAAKDTADDINDSSVVSPAGDFYTKKNDLSNGLASRVNYQQVIDAVHDFDNTFIVQGPNMLVSGLNLLRGSGCEYPPRVVIDFHNSLSSEPIVISFGPFVSVANVMKFFFSLLCLFMTIKMVINLFD